MRRQPIDNPCPDPDICSVSVFPHTVTGDFPRPAPEVQLPVLPGICSCGGACAGQIAAQPRPEGHAIDCFTPGCGGSCLDADSGPGDLSPDGILYTP